MAAPAGSTAACAALTLAVADLGGDWGD